MPEINRRKFLIASAGVNVGRHRDLQHPLTNEAGRAYDRTVILTVDNMARPPKAGSCDESQRPAWAARESVSLAARAKSPAYPAPRRRGIAAIARPSGPMRILALFFSAPRRMTLAAFSGEVSAARAKSLAASSGSSVSAVRMLVPKLVRTTPGCTQCTVTGRRSMIISWRSDSVNPRTANFAALYALCPGTDSNPNRLEMLTRCPSPDAITLAGEPGELHARVLAGAGLDELREEGLGAVDDSPDVDPDEPVIIRPRHVCHAGEEVDAGVVEQHRCRPESAAHLFGVCEHRVAIGDVDPVRADVAWPGQRLRFGQTPFVDVGRRDVRPVLSERVRQRPADAGTGAGDHGDTVSVGHQPFTACSRAHR